VATSGPALVVGEITVAGNTNVSADIIRRSLSFDTGEVVRVSAIGRSQRRLYDLELFDFVNIDMPLEELAGAEAPIRIVVTEGRQRRVELSGGYGTEEHLRTEAAWRSLNWFGGARELSVRGKWSSLDRGLRSELTQPFVVGPGSTLSVSGQRWYADEPAYSIDTTGARVALSYDLPVGVSDAVCRRSRLTRRASVARKA
jgi:outer membrane protein assembly factor BamA